MERLPSLRNMMKTQTSLRSLHQPRQNSFSSLSLVLRSTDLLSLVSKISAQARESEREYCDQLQRSLRKGVTLESLDLEEVSCFLEEYLSSTCDIPSDLAVDIHSCIGLLQEKLGLVERSLRSLLRALWVQEKVSTDKVDIAVTEHRLALVYAKSGDYQKSVHLLEKATAAYMEARMRPDHNCLLEAEQSLKEFRLKRIESGLNDKTVRTESLTDIFEEGPSIAAM